MEVETAISVQACVIRDPSPTPTSLTSLFPSSSPYMGNMRWRGVGGGTEFHHNSCYLVYVPIFYHICVYGSSCNHLFLASFFLLFFVFLFKAGWDAKK